MNYRHAFHAGGFADVFKHVVLARMLVHLRAKPAPFRVIDTHAGAGLYELSGPQAGCSLEWRDGIARLCSAPVAAAARALLTPYLDVVVRLNPPGELVVYPGSPLLVRAFLRSSDRLLACELEPNAAAALGRHLGGDRRSKALAIDGWTALNANVPPTERRGLVLIDPPFEEASDFSRLAQALPAAYRKWATGMYLAWYPIKERAPAEALARRLRSSGIANVLRAELAVARPQPAGPLRGCGLIVVNPPWKLEDELNVVLPALADSLAVADGSGCRIEKLVPPI